MTGKTHRFIGIAAGTSYLAYCSTPIYSPATAAAVLVSSYLSSLIPDLDRSNADIWDHLPLGKTMGKVVDPFFKHRNISHSILGILLFYFLFKLLLDSLPAYWGINTKTVLISATLSYVSHLLADMFTVDGIPLLYPLKHPIGIPPKPLEGIRIVSGKWFENLVIFPLVNLYLAVMIILRWPVIKQILFK